jgi:hypothetical protein
MSESSNQNDSRRRSASSSRPVRLREEEREVVRAEVHAVYALAGDPDYRDELAGLLAAVEEGELGPAEATSLERVVELALQTGRIRALYGPGGEQAALRLYRRLPRGSEVRESAREVSDALDALSGRRLAAVKLEATGPGSFALTLAVDGADVAVRLDRQGARLTSVGT